MSKVDKGQVEAKIKQMISERLEIQLEKISSDSKLRDDLGIDSFGAVEVAFEVKDKLGATISEEDFKSIVTVGNMADCVFNKIKGG